jgi:hypothetical protein
MPLMAAHKPSRRPWCERGSSAIDDKDYGADAEAKTVEAVAAETMRSIQPYGSLPEKRAVT